MLEGCSSILSRNVRAIFKDCRSCLKVRYEGAPLALALRKANEAPFGDSVMKIKNSLKALMGRHRDNRMVRRKGRVYIINKKNPRFKARQG